MFSITLFIIKLAIYLYLTKYNYKNIYKIIQRRANEGSIHVPYASGKLATQQIYIPTNCQFIRHAQRLSPSLTNSVRKIEEILLSSHQ